MSGDRILCRIPPVTQAWISLALACITVLCFYAEEWNVNTLESRFLAIAMVAVSCWWYVYLIRSAQGRRHSLRVDGEGIATPFAHISWSEVAGAEVGRLPLTDSRSLPIAALRIRLNDGHGVDERRGWFWGLWATNPEKREADTIPAFLLDLPARKVVAEIERLREKHA